MYLRRKTSQAGINYSRGKTSRGDLIETYKIITGKEKVCIQDFFNFYQSNYELRGHRHKLIVTSRSRLEVRRNYFSQQVVGPWNRLPSQWSHFVDATRLPPTHSRTVLTGGRKGHHIALGASQVRHLQVQVSLRNLQNALRNLEIAVAQFSNLRPKVRTQTPKCPLRTSLFRISRENLFYLFYVWFVVTSLWI